MPDGCRAAAGPNRLFCATQLTVYGQAARIANNAGTFGCNDWLCSLPHHFHNTPNWVGFIHIPALPDQV
ncbi:MAG: hypothetical protein IIU86_01640 [Oscillospiraceae bacterium]|nr:hypothetical protein [Oscillospiraceae bacterium]